MINVMEWTRGHILGRGSSATVSIATSTSGDTFAVKSAPLSTSEALQREQKFLSILCSPYLVGYKGFDITQENNTLMYNLMMQYMSEGSLVDVSRRRLLHEEEEEEISKYTRQILQGLEYIHSWGIVHCDIKGRNVLVDKSGAKIADFGCAKWADQVSPVGGTPMFMAPEVARGEEQGFPADIWALGCTVIEVVTGASPWANVDDQMSILYRIAFSAELPDIPDVLSDQAKDFVNKCLRRDPKERWTAKQLLKHPFVEESKNQGKNITCKELHTDSPTSILDQDVWKSMEEWVSMGSDVVQSTESWSYPRQRIKQLADDSETGNWRVEEELDWITIRRHEEAGKAVSGVGDEMEVDGTLSDDDDHRLIINFIDTKVGCRYSSNLLLSCRFGDNSSIADRSRQPLC